MRLYAFNEKSAKRVDRILGLLPMQKWSPILLGGLIGERTLEELLAKWCPEACNQSGCPTLLLENIQDFPRFFVNYAFPDSKDDDEEDEFPPFNNMVVDRIKRLLQTDFYLDHRYPELVDFVVDSFNLAEIEPEVESDLYL